jgi:crotonobetainyl-CoA:carnitine CoA-transferase CaiB-like acyl-CoA transferase
VLCDELAATDLRFATNNDRVANRAQLDALIQAWFGSTSRIEIVTALLDAQIAFGAVNDVAGLSAHPQLRRVRIDTEHGVVEMPAHPLRASYWPVYGATPALGQHTNGIRIEFGGVK